jgi:hypothetical protein
VDQWRRLTNAKEETIHHLQEQVWPCHMSPQLLSKG